MLSELVGDADEVQGVKDVIVTRTEGNPFFMEEMRGRCSTKAC
jgi:hypothetical protein